MVGRNCVYGDSTLAKYRVSIRTPDGWKSYGHFNDLGAATYVANIAILAEGCEEQYELNREIGPKDRDELSRWRAQLDNAALEQVARDRYAEVSSALELLRLEEERQNKERERLSREQAQAIYNKTLEEMDRIRQEQAQQAVREAEQLMNIPTAALLNALQGDISGSQCRAIRAALDARGFGRRAT